MDGWISGGTGGSPRTKRDDCNFGHVYGLRGLSSPRDQAVVSWAGPLAEDPHLESPNVTLLGTADHGDLTELASCGYDDALAVHPNSPMSEAALTLHHFRLLHLEVAAALRDEGTLTYRRCISIAGQALPVMEDKLRLDIEGWREIEAEEDLVTDGSQYASPSRWLAKGIQALRIQIDRLERKSWGSS